MSSCEDSLDTTIEQLVFDSIRAFHHEDGEHHEVTLETNVADLGIDVTALVMEIEEGCFDLDDMRKSDAGHFFISDERLKRVITVSDLITQTYDAVVDVVGVRNRSCPDRPEPRIEVFHPERLHN